jgi:lipooligosaccharide transport system ATP-binding protein
MVLTTHYMDEAENLCDRLVILDRGRIVTEGRPHDLIKKYAGESVIDIEGPGEELRKYVKDNGVESDDLGERLIIYAEPGGELESRIREEFCMESCRFRAGNLEDVFLRLTGRELRE